MHMEYFAGGFLGLLIICQIFYFHTLLQNLFLL